MKTQTLLLISITASLVLSLVATLASYYVIRRSDLITVPETAWAYRGWPLYWMLESSSWSIFSPHHFTLQPVSFLVDFAFYAIVFLTPMLIYTYSKENMKSHARTNVGAP